MKKLILIAVLFLYSGVIYSQNNAIFFGGQGDGVNRNSFNQNYTPKTNTGGFGDGISMNNYIQNYAGSSNKGGIGDGANLNNFVQNYTPKTNNGGIGDGWNMNNFAQNYTPKTNNGGIGDGWNMNNFAQNYTPKTNNGGLGDGWASNVIPLSPLPVELLSFTGREVNETHLLEWKTSLEQNSSHFVIEHSVNATSFLELGMRDAAGNSSTEKQYEFTNSRPVIGDNFYRLKMVDLDGKSKYSNVVLLRLMKDKSSIAVYPNPTADILNISIDKELNNQKMQFQVMDMQGKVLQQQEVQHDKTSYQINVSSYANGVYFIKINSNGNSEIVKFRISK